MPFIDSTPNPFLDGFKEGEDPIAVAGREMAATQQVYDAQQKGLSKGVLTGAPSPATMAKLMTEQGLQKAQPAPMVPSTKLKKPPKDPEQVKEEKDSKDELTKASEAFLEATTEGDLRKSFGTLTKCMSEGQSSFFGTPFEKEALDAQIEYKKTVLGIRKQPLSAVESEKRYILLDQARKVYNEKLDELEIHKLERDRELLGKSGAEIFGDLLSKAEGSKGGRVIGHTKSGKPIYDTHGHSGHAGFTTQDHEDAMHAHAGLISRASKRDDNKTVVAHRRQQLMHQQSAKGVQKSGDPILDLLQKAEGEGSRGGKVIGHYPNGKPIYASASWMTEEHMKHAESHPHGNYHVEAQGAGHHQLYFTAKGKRKPEAAGGFDSVESAKKGIELHTQTGWSKPSSIGSKINPSAKWLQKSTNPWAVCHASTGPAKDEKFESCVQKVKKEEGIVKSDFHLTEPFEKAAEGEGSRGGRVIGHTAGGKPIYAPSAEAIAHMREHVNLQKKTAKGKLADHAASHLGRHGKGYEAEDHKAAADAHAQEARDFKNSDKVRALHEAISEAHAAKASGKMTPSAQAEAKRQKAAESKAKRDAKKETERKKDVVATAPGGHKILNTHHIRHSAVGTSMHEGPAAGAGGKFGVRHEPVETEWGSHLTAKQHRDIAEHHKGEAHKFAAKHEAEGAPRLVMADGVHRIGGTGDSGVKSHMHEFAAKKHEEEAVRKEAQEPKNPGQASFTFQKSGDSMNASDILNLFLKSQQITEGNPPSELPKTLREGTDGGDLDPHETPSGSPGAVKVPDAGSPKSRDVDLQAQTPGDQDALTKALHALENAPGDGLYERAKLLSALLHPQGDVRLMGAPKRTLEKSAEARPQREIYVQQTDTPMYYYTNEEDMRIEKSLEAAAPRSLVFTQPAHINLGSPLHKSVTCPHCANLTKSYLSSCEECGQSLVGQALQKSSVPGPRWNWEEDDVYIG